MRSPYEINRRRFWDIYFQNRFVELYRHPSGYSGRCSRERASLRTFLGEPEYEAITITHTEITGHDYDNDGRFAQLKNVPATLHEAVYRLVETSYPYRVPPPFGSKRMSELMAHTALRFMWPDDESLRLDQVHATVRALQSSLPGSSQQLDAVIWLLGERQERMSARTIVDGIVASEQLPGGHKNKLSHSVLSTSFEALVKINNKSVFEPLLAVMDGSQHSGRLRIAALFKRLFSTTHLLSLQALGEDYFSPQYWRREFHPYANFTDIQWDRFDADSLFWETRFQATRRLVHGDATLRKLRDDEVSLVSNLARQKSS